VGVSEYAPYMPYSDVVVGQNVELDFAHLANEYTGAYLRIFSFLS
jgi:hypothetical protein